MALDLNKILRSTGSAVDDIVKALAPGLALKRAGYRAQLDYVQSNSGYHVPGNHGDYSRPMYGLDLSSNSPDSDINDKLSGMRALSHDLYMSTAIVPAILRKHKTLSIGSGLQFQSIPDFTTLGISSEAAKNFSAKFEAEVDLWSNSYCSDFSGMNYFGDNQALGHFNRLLSGDFFFMPVWRDPEETDFPYNLCIKLIDADLVRNPRVKKSISDDVEGGVEKKEGKVIGYHVWNCYDGEYVSGGTKCTFVPVVVDGYRQIFHVYDPERINQRRGVPLIAPVASMIKQASRLTDAAVMNALLANYFTVFVRDANNMGIGAMVPTTSFDTADAVYSEKTGNNDIKMGPGNVVNLGTNKSIEIASPQKTDQNFGTFWDSLMLQICGSSWSVKGQALGKYDDSYTAARAAGNDLWNYRLVERELQKRRMNDPITQEVASEAILKNRLQAPGFFEDYSIRKAWLRANWIGAGRGTLNPVDEARASQIEIDTFLTTREEAFTSRTGGRWDRAFERAIAEMKRIEEEGYPAITSVKNMKNPVNNESGEK